MCPPWINRYYIADLAPKKSLIEWAVQHGHTTFAISYRNPDESMRDNTFDDYVRLGPLTAIDVVREIADTDVVNTLGDLSRRHDEHDDARVPRGGRRPPGERDHAAQFCDRL